MRIIECSYDDIKHLASAGAREGVSIKPSRDTVWFAVLNREGVAVGCGAVMKRPKVNRLKAQYIRPQYRGNGWGRELNDARVSHDPSTPMEVLTLNAPAWDKRGFTRVRQDKKGSWWMRWEPPVPSDNR